MFMIYIWPIKKAIVFMLSMWINAWVTLLMYFLQHVDLMHLVTQILWEKGMLLL